MAGLSQSGSGKPPARKRSRKPRERTPDASLSPGTTHNDLGLGRKLADPEAERTWAFVIRRQGSMAGGRSGFSTCTTYVDANDAAGDILGEYFELSGVPVEGRRVYTCDVHGVGINHGQEGGAEGRDWA